MSYEPMSQESIDEMDRYIVYRMADEGIPMDPLNINIGIWMSEHMHELKDKPLIDAYLLVKEGS